MHPFLDKQLNFAEIDFVIFQTHLEGLAIFDLEKAVNEISFCRLIINKTTSELKKMRIEYEVKLDFKDVLIRPKRSTLRSRAEVDLNRTFRFKHTGKEWTGVPIFAANMDSTGTFEVAATFAKVILKKMII